MPQPPLPPEELKRRLDARAQHGSIKAAAQALGIPRTTLASTLDDHRTGAFGLSQHLGRVDIGIENGVVLVGSDAHIWDVIPSPAMRAFLWAIKRFRKRGELHAVILNGDVVDGARISRHPSIGWESKPTFFEELVGAQTQLREITKAGGKGINYEWPFGNHDMRLESAIANALPALERVNGVHLKDHFPDWRPSWMVWINDLLVVKHRFKGGINAPRNNTVFAGKSMATGHLHNLQVMPFSDYNGTRWGVDTGMLATPYSPQFIHYTEANPVNWRAGFAVFTFCEGALLQPELVIVRDADSWEFRGEIHHG